MRHQSIFCQRASAPRSSAASPRLLSLLSGVSRVTASAAVAGAELFT
jgi:hypothetical protein